MWRISEAPCECPESKIHCINTAVILNGVRLGGRSRRICGCLSTNIRFTTVATFRSVFESAGSSGAFLFQVPHDRACGLGPLYTCAWPGFPFDWCAIGTSARRNGEEIKRNFAVLDRIVSCRSSHSAGQQRLDRKHTGEVDFDGVGNGEFPERADRVAAVRQRSFAACRIQFAGKARVGK